MRKTSRPKWAKNLTNQQWRDLHGCQKTGKKNPTLAQLRRDVEWQKANGVRCSQCWNALANAS